MMLYKDTKAMVCSPDGDTDFFDIAAGVLQGDTLAPYIFIICIDYDRLDYVLRTSLDIIKEKCFTLRKARSRRYPTQTVTDADYADDLAPAQAESLLHSLEKAAKNIGLYVNSDKTESMGFT